MFHWLFIVREFTYNTVTDRRTEGGVVDSFFTYSIKFFVVESLRQTSFPVLHPAMFAFFLNISTVGSRFATVRFMTIHFTTFTKSDRELPTFGASLSQPKRPFCIYCASRFFPACKCSFFFYFSAVLLTL
jgi:hypothetical protein